MIRLISYILHAVYPAALAVVVIELFFYLIFILYLKPRANDLSKRTIQKYRDYGTKRHLLFKRILERIHARCRREKKELKRELDMFFWSWFYTNEGCGCEERLLLRSAGAAAAAAAGGMEETAEEEESEESGSTSKLEKPQPPTDCKIRPSISSSSLSTLSHTSEAFSLDLKGHRGRFGMGKTVQTKNHHIDIVDGIELYQDELKLFFAWAFFDKPFTHLDQWELEEMDLMFHYLRDRYRIQYPLASGFREKKDGGSESRSKSDNEEKDDTLFMRPRCMTLEDVNALHRPIFLYAFFWILRHIGYRILRLLGFRHYTVRCDLDPDADTDCDSISDSTKVLRYWFLPGDVEQCGSPSSNEAILFFHGIAPGGLTFYIPFLKRCIINRNDSTCSNDTQRQRQSIFLFENIPITSSSLSFRALTEEETVRAVERALTKHGFDEKGRSLTLSGHSFGSFQLTWLLKSSFMKERMHKIILLDPVSILLSEPHVIMNFVYDGGNEERTARCWLKSNGTRLKIKLLASSELFIEHYLRRHFAWYNSELWMEDIPDHVQTYVMISGNDAIIHASKVRQEVHRHSNSKRVKCIFWKGHDHGDCLIHSKLITDVSRAFSSSHRKQD